MKALIELLGKILEELQSIRFELECANEREKYR